MSAFNWSLCVLLLCACSERPNNSNAPVDDIVEQPVTSDPKINPKTEQPKTQGKTNQPKTQGKTKQPKIQPASTMSTATMSVKIRMFGELSIADGMVMVMDGGIHGVQGHTLSIPAQGPSSWKRRIDSFRPRGKAGAGQLQLNNTETTQLRDWADELWQLAPEGKASFTPPIESGVPRWIWAIVLRRGDELRILSGGSNSSPKGAPDAAKPVLKWLVTRVDTESEAMP